MLNRFSQAIAYQKEQTKLHSISVLSVFRNAKIKMTFFIVENTQESGPKTMSKI